MHLTPSAIERRKSYIAAFVARAAREADVFATNDLAEEAYNVLDSASSCSSVCKAEEESRN